MPSLRDRRRAQAGTTLVELLVSLVIVGMALVLLVGTLSTGLLDAALAKRNTAALAVSQYELDRVSARTFANPQSYSECFATETTASPAQVGYRASCPGGTWALRADVTWAAGPSSTQIWTVTVKTWPSLAAIGASVSVLKADR